MILSKNRVAIFAHFDKNNKIEDYVIYYLNGLKKVTDKIIFVSDSNIKKNELDKIANIVDYLIVGRHGEYDFGSYKRGYMYAKEQNFLENCEELIFANDSCYAPLYSFVNMFDEMSKKSVDFWGVTMNKNGCVIENNKIIKKPLEHIQSYFLVFKANVFNSKIFDDFICSIKKLKTKDEIVALYEVGLSQILINGGFNFDVYCENSKKVINSHLSIWKKLISKDKSPFLKRSIPLYKNAKHNYPINLKYFLKKFTNYNFNLIELDRQTNAKNISKLQKFYFYLRNLRKEIISIRLKTKEFVFFGNFYQINSNYKS